MHRLKVLLVIGAGFCFLGGMGLTAQEEHPQGKPEQGQEHPKADDSSAKLVSMDTLEKAIKDQIAKRSKANEGKFTVQDDVLHKTWQLELLRVHTDKLTQLDDKTYFACVDFKADDGTIVDVDFYMKKDNDQLTLSDTTVHKVNGRPRYMYQKKGDFWERVPVND